MFVGGASGGVVGGTGGVGYCCGWLGNCFWVSGRGFWVLGSGVPVFGIPWACSHSRVYEMNFGFRLKRGIAVKWFDFSFFQEFFGSIGKVFILAGGVGAGLGWATDLIGIFLMFPNFLRFYGKQFSSSHIPCLLLIIPLRFTCGEKKIWQNVK